MRGSRPQEGGNFIDRTGQRYGKLVAVRRVEDRPVPYVRKSGRPYCPEVQWLCICDCGNERIVTAGRLRDGGTTSCGCSRREPRPSYRLRNPPPPGRGARNVVLKQYRLSARHRGLAWELNGEEFDKLTAQDCSYCGCPPSAVKQTGRSSGEFVYNGLDRVDNTLGYVLENVVACCSTCNHAKKDMSRGQFMAWIARLAAFNAAAQVNAPGQRNEPGNVRWATAKEQAANRSPRGALAA